MKIFKLGNIQKYSMFDKVLLIVDVGLLLFIYLYDWGNNNFMYKSAASIIFIISIIFQLKQTSE